MTDEERRRLRDIAKQVCERWGKEHSEDPPAFLPVEDRLHSSFTDEECAAFYAVWLKERDEYAIGENHRDSVDPSADGDMSVPGMVMWGWLCHNRDALATPETLQRGKSWLQEGSEVDADYVESPLGQRDKWVYEQRKAGCQNQEVIDELERIFSRHNWEHLTTSRGIRDAVNRWVLRTGADPLKPDKGGRPRTKTRK